MAEAGLTLHPQKTRLVDMNQEKACFEFLGYRFYRTKAGKMGHIPRSKSTKSLQERLKPLTKRANGHGIRKPPLLCVRAPTTSWSTRR